MENDPVIPPGRVEIFPSSTCYDNNDNNWSLSQFNVIK